MRRGGRRARAFGTTLVLLVGLAVMTGPTVARAGGYGSQRLGVPAYWDASTPQGAAEFDRLVAAASTVDMVIVNGSASGPADPFSPALASSISRLRRKGITVLGYVDTGYLGHTGATTTRVRPGSTAVTDWQAQAATDVRAWYDLYGRHGLGGIFLDQTVPTCGDADEHVDAYGTITGRIWRRDSDALVAINPGMSVEECYTEVADVIVLAENTFSAYRDWTPPAWVYRHPASSFWHLVHATPTTAQMREAVELAWQRNAGYVYVTDAVVDPVGGPWNALPPPDYWSAQLAAVRANRGRCPTVTAG